MRMEGVELQKSYKTNTNKDLHQEDLFQSNFLQIHSKKGILPSITIEEKSFLTKIIQNINI